MIFKKRKKIKSEIAISNWQLAVSSPHHFYPYLPRILCGTGFALYPLWFGVDKNGACGKFFLAFSKKI